MDNNVRSGKKKPTLRIVAVDYNGIPTIKGNRNSLCRELGKSEGYWAKKPFPWVFNEGTEKQVTYFLCEVPKQKKGRWKEAGKVKKKDKK